MSFRVGILRIWALNACERLEGRQILVVREIRRGLDWK